METPPQNTPSREHDSYAERFRGTERLYGTDAMMRFTQARVAVIGLGGVGSWVAEGLARSGVGSLTLVDLDELCLNNINRQIHADDMHIGTLKCSALRNRIHSYHPRCSVHAVAEFLTDDTAEQILTEDLDMVVDAIDSVKNKSILIATCLRKQIPVVTAGGAGGRSDPTKLRLSPLSGSHDDALLRHVRRVLRKEHGLDKPQLQRVQAVFSIEPRRLSQPEPAGADSDAEPSCLSPSPRIPSGGSRLDCASGFGTVIHVTASMGLMISHLVLESLACP
jgi:tRNA A37 threonylcarbamoyladenosine dehydratase